MCSVHCASRDADKHAAATEDIVNAASALGLRSHQDQGQIPRLFCAVEYNEKQQRRKNAGRLKGLQF